MERPGFRLMPVAFFGQFDGGDSGAESPPQATPRRLRRLDLDALETCGSPAHQRAGADVGGQAGEVRGFD
jgi:hypothetical protein